MTDETLKLMDDVIEEIMASSAYQGYKKLHEAIQNDETLNHLIETFITQREAYESVRQYSHYHPDLKRVKGAFSTAKHALYSHPTIKAYFEAKREIDGMLAAITTRIARTVSTHVPIQTSTISGIQGGDRLCKIEKV